VSEVHGPIDFLLLEFESDKLQGQTAAAMTDLIDRGLVRLYDLVVVQKDGDSVVALELTSEDLGGLGVFGGARSGLLGPEDLAEVADVLSPGATGVLLVYENTWAVPFVSAALKEGGTPIASVRLPATDVMAVLDALEAEES